MVGLGNLRQGRRRPLDLSPLVGTFFYPANIRRLFREGIIKFLYLSLLSKSLFESSPRLILKSWYFIDQTLTYSRLLPFSIQILTPHFHLLPIRALTVNIRFAFQYDLTTVKLSFISLYSTLFFLYQKSSIGFYQINK